MVAYLMDNSPPENIDDRLSKLSCSGESSSGGMVVEPDFRAVLLIYSPNPQVPWMHDCDVEALKELLGSGKNDLWHVLVGG